MSQRVRIHFKIHVTKHYQFSYESETKKQNLNENSNHIQSIKMKFDSWKSNQSQVELFWSRMFSSKQMKKKAFIDLNIYDNYKQMRFFKIFTTIEYYNSE